ncbi:MAG TPA: hypothetical protein VKE93_16120 [Candidatus Angelobacter sp.]|nr:hypothetical protein [Candidatus Angelobacter sp.]
MQKLRAEDGGVEQALQACGEKVARIGLQPLRWFSSGDEFKMYLSG